MKNPLVLYATTNPGKFGEVSSFLSYYRIAVRSPRDLGLKLEVPEDGQTLEDNATQKAQVYLGAGVSLPVVADDTGVFIDALGGAPGLHTRRWAGHRMTDAEIIAYCIKLLEGIPPEGRGATFRTVVAVGNPTTGAIELFEGAIRGTIVEKPAPLKIKGFPFESLFFIPDYQLLLGQLHQIPVADRMDRLIHREKAFRAALATIRKLTS